MKGVRLAASSVLLAVLSAGVAYSAQSARAMALPDGVARGPSVEGITEYRLPNGLQVLLFPDPSKATITVNITYLVGSKHEDYGETGMAHLLEHLLFKGSVKHPDIDKELQSHGARPNGSTWVDRTNYFETFQATDDNLEWALDLEADRMVNSFIAKKDLDSEMTVVRNEFESGENSPMRVLLDRVTETAYIWHNYGKSTIGARSDIEHVPIDRLQLFYKTHYQPDDAVLLVAGKFDEAKTLALIGKHFGSIPRPERKLRPSYTVEPTQDGERSVTLRRVGEVQGVIAGYHVPAGSHPDFAPLDIATQILSSTPSGRLHQALVETKKATRVGGFSFQFKEPGMVAFQAQVRKEASLDDARDTLLATVDGIRTNLFTKEEVERARTQLLKSIDLLLNNSASVGLQMSEWAAMGDWRLLFLHRDRLRKAPVEDVQRVATYYFKPSNRTVGLFIPAAQPDRAEIPADPDVVAMLKDYKGDAAVAVGEAFDASPANIDARTRRGQLQDGLKLAFLSKKTRGNTVSATLRLHFGDEESLRNQSIAAGLASQMLLRGTTKRTRQQIQDEFDKLKARVFIVGGSTAATVSVETIAQNLPAVLGVLDEILHEPSFPPSEFEQLRQQQLAGAEAQKTEPQAVARTAFQRHMHPYPKGDVRYVPTFEEEIADLKALTLDDVKKFYATFYGASHAELAIVGDFDAEQVQQLASKLFGSWKSSKPYAKVKNPYRKIDPVSQSFETPDKANAFFVAGVPLHLGDDHPDYPALMFGNYLLGSGMNSRLFQRIRGKEGLSYGVGSILQATPEEDNTPFQALAICAPQNIKKVEASFRDEMAKILKEGYSEQEVTAGKTGWLQSQQVSRSQDRELVSKLASWTHYGRTMAWDEDVQKKVQALTPEQIMSAMRKYLDPASMTFMKAGDFKKAGVQDP